MTAGLRLNRVLCALDLECRPHAPLAHAGWLANEFGVALDGLYVSAPLMDWGGRLERVRRLIAEHNAHEQLDALLAPFASSLDVQSFVTRGVSEDVIGAHAREHQADLIVLGGSRKSVGGGAASLASILSEQTEGAVLTVPSDSAACTLRRLLIPVTLTTPDSPAVLWATTLARRFGASVKVTGVLPAHSHLWSVLTRQQPARAALEHNLSVAVQRVVLSLDQAGVAVEALPAPLLSVTDLAQLAEATAFDLIVLGLPRRSADGPEAALLERLRRTGSSPLLSIRARPAGIATRQRPSLEFEPAHLISA